MRAQEHRALGDEAAGGAMVELGSMDGGHGLRLSFGDVVALSADYFVAEGLAATGDGQAPAAAQELADGGLFELAAVAGQLGTRLGTSDEIVAALWVMAADQMTVDRRRVRRTNAALSPISRGTRGRRSWAVIDAGVWTP